MEYLIFYVTKLITRVKRKIFTKNKRYFSFLFCYFRYDDRHDRCLNDAAKV